MCEQDWVDGNRAAVPADKTANLVSVTKVTDLRNNENIVCN